MVFRVVVLDNSGRKAIYTPPLRQKSSSKAIGSIDTLLAINSISLMFAEEDID